MSISNSSPALRRADVDYLVRNAMLSGYQLFSLLTPSIYLATLYARRRPGSSSSFTVNRLLRATWVGGITGSVGSGGIAYLRYANSAEDKIHTKRIEAIYNTSRVRRDDYATIGAVLLGVLTPAVLWKRASTVNLLLGGAGFGSVIGATTHYFRSFSSNPPPKVTPAMQVIETSQK